MRYKIEELNKYIGKMFGDWLVIGIGEPKVFTQKSGYIMKNTTLKAKCTCGFCNEKIEDIVVSRLINGRTKHCKKKRTFSKKLTDFNIDGDYGIGILIDGENFNFDLEDYEKIKDYTWHKNSCGYICTNVYEDGKYVVKNLHKLIFQVKDESNVIDHIDKNRLNNRKSNLRECKQIDNCKNRKLGINNSSGVTGITQNRNDCWIVRIMVDKVSINLGTFKNIEDAIKARLKAEKEYFGEFAPQQHLFEQYEIQ